MNINIKQEIKELIPALTKEEFEQLESNIKAEGCRDPLVLANVEEEEFLADGHNRLDICERNNIPFTTVTKKFENLNEVKIWVAKNQLGRRNISVFTRAELVEHLRVIFEEKAKKNLSLGGQLKGEALFDVKQGSIEIKKVDVSHEVAKIAGLGRNTLIEHKQIKEFYENDSEEIQSLRNNEKSIHEVAKKIRGFGKVRPENKEQVKRLIKTGQAIDVKQATKIVQQNQRKEEVKSIVDTNPNIVVKHGDAVEQLKTIEANSIDCVVTDSPYGVNYSDSRETFNTEYKDETQYALKLLDETCNELKRVCKEDAHLYFFSGYINMFEFKTIISKYFNVHDNPIIWVKNNHTLCDFTKRYASKYEIIWFCSNKQRMLNNPVSPDVLTHAIPLNKQHSAQKPVELLEYLIKNSTVEGEVVLDCFAGSGSTGVACKNTNRKSVLIELEEENINLIKDNLK